MPGGIICCDNDDLGRSSVACSSIGTGTGGGMKGRKFLAKSRTFVGMLNVLPVCIVDVCCSRFVEDADSIAERRSTSSAGVRCVPLGLDGRDCSWCGLG